MDKSTNEDEENNIINTNSDNAQPVNTPQRRRMAPSVDLSFMSPIMSPPPGMILDEDEICTPNGISRAESGSDFDSLNGFTLPPSQAFVAFTPHRLNFNSPSLSVDTDLTQNPPPPPTVISPYKLRSSRLARCTTFSPTLKDHTMQINNTVFSQKPRAMTSLESDIIIPDWGDDAYNIDTEDSESSSPSPNRYNRKEAKSAMEHTSTPQLYRSHTTIDGVNDPLTATKRSEKNKNSTDSNNSSSSSTDKSRRRRRMPPFSPERAGPPAQREKLISQSAGDSSFAEYAVTHKNRGCDRPKSTGCGGMVFNGFSNFSNLENFFPMSEIPYDLMRLKNFVLHCPFDNERDPRWFRCMIRRRKDPKTVYECGFFRDEDPSQFLVISYARRKRFISTTKYIISLLESDLFDKIKGEGYLGKLQCNFKKTIFMLFSDYLDDEPDSYINYGIIMKTPNNKNPAYNYQVCIPSLLRNGEPSYIWRSIKNEKDPLYQAFVEIQEKGAQNALYEDKIKCFSLPTRIIGRTVQYHMTTVNSIKNCSLIKASPESLPLKMDLFKSSSKLVNNLDDLDTCFRFSKTSDCLYTLDFRYPFSLFQAFAVALSRF